MNNKKLIVGITAAGSVGLIHGQLKYFKNLGYKTYLMAPKADRSIKYCQEEGCSLLDVKIEREISLINDIKSLIHIIRVLRKVKPDIVNMGTPKMGLLGMIASKLLGVKKRVYTCRGFRFEQEKGIKKQILIKMEQISGFCANDIICISPSLKEYGIKHKIFNKDKCHVINKGSSNGINLNRFNPQTINKNETEQLKNTLNINNTFVFGFVGRVNRQKGVTELYNAFTKINKQHPNTRLLLVGLVEEKSFSDKNVLEQLNQDNNVRIVGSQRNVPLYLSTIDILVLPTWREGFGNVCVEAAAMGKPVITTDGTGSRSAIQNGYNGKLVQTKNEQQLTEAMTSLLLNNEERKEMGNNGILWAKNFDNKIIWDGMNKLYSSK